jgi:hypothetical protein
VTLGAEGEEALKTDDGLRLVGMMIKLKEKGATLTWGPGPSSDPGSEIVAAAAGAPGGDHPQMVVVAAGPMVMVVVGAAGPMVVVGRLRNKRPVSATQPVSPLFLRPPGAT